MKWPFARHSHAPESPPPGKTVAPSRRDWATLPPLQVAGGRPITLTAGVRAFTESLASRQVLVRAPRLEHVRRMDAPSGSFRGVLAPSNSDHGASPELQEPSTLPAIEHRQLSAVAADKRAGHALSPIEQLLAIDQPIVANPLPATAPDRILTQPATSDDDPRDGGDAPAPRRAGLADSRRHGLGPAYHGPLPEAMRAERDRVETPTTEPVPGDVRSTMRDVLGIDVGDRLVHRGPAVSAEAKTMGAQAFTRDGEVHIADDVGPLDGPIGRATLAHELTHAAQQIVRHAVPDEASADGKMMEAHAQRVEQYVRGDATATKPSPELLHARPQITETGESDLARSTRQMMRELIETGLARSDGDGGIVFTMPPSAMTGTRGTQRLEASAPHAASQEHWDPLATFGHTIGQGLSNDMLGIAGSFLGFSDEFMGEQRHDLISEDRQFRRDQVTRAYTDLRMEHLRSVELRQHNDSESAAGVSHSTSLSTHDLEAIQQRVTHEVTARLTLLDEQSAEALDRLNQRRTASHQPALLDVPDENFIAAITSLFDNPDTDTPPTADALLATLTQTQRTDGFPGGATRPGGGPPLTPRPPGAIAPTTPTGTSPSTTPSPATTPTPPGSSPTSGTAPGTVPGTVPATATGTAPVPGTVPATVPATVPGTVPGAHTADQDQPDEPWRTAPTMGGRFEGIATGLAHNELALFGSFLGFDSGFEQGLHEQISPHHDAAAAATPTPATTPPPASTPAPGVTPHPDAAHPDAAHGVGAHAAGDHVTTPAHESVDHIVSDPYALDELANRLYPNIRTRLRQELLIDRERAGLLADFR